MMCDCQCKQCLEVGPHNLLYHMLHYNHSSDYIIERLSDTCQSN